MEPWLIRPVFSGYFIKNGLEKDQNWLARGGLINRYLLYLQESMLQVFIIDEMIVMM